MRRALAVLIVCVAIPAPAGAATVRVGDPPPRPAYPGQYDYPDSGWLYYTAAAGERNRVQLSFSEDSNLDTIVTVHDPGATVQTGRLCTSLGPHTARCHGRRLEAIRAAEFRLGDRDDEFRSGPGARSYPTALTVFGGPGNELLVGGGGSDGLLGGGGRDRMFGGRSTDFLADADGPSAPDQDVLDGGPGEDDTVAYLERSRGVTVDALNETPAGEPGERDTIRGIEHAYGGSGDDRLVGDDESSELQGRLGDDVLIGRGGGLDILLGGRGRDRLDGGRGYDWLITGPGRDKVNCGPGRDVVFEPIALELLGLRCEGVNFHTDVEGVLGEDVGYDAHPKAVGRRTMRWNIKCPFFDNDGEYVPCGGKLSVRQASGRRRLVARGSFDIAGELGERRVRTRLTRRGRRLVRRRNGVVSVVTLKVEGFETVRWRVRIKR